jgi:hypothetical protein
MMHIVVFAPQDGDVRAALSDLLPTDELIVVRWQGGDIEVGAIQVAEHPLAKRLVEALSRTLPGRMLVRVLPLDTGARFWRSTRRSAEIARRVHEADLLVAAERDAGFAVWQWLRRAGVPSPAGVRGFPAARTWIEKRRQP